ncbi:hypothetical protein BH11BAC3_BH11BAC3_22220 [soil metagenome]
MKQLSINQSFKRLQLRLLIVFTAIATSFSMNTLIAQTTYDFSTAPSLSKAGGYYYTEATMTIGGTPFKLTHLGNGSFSNQASGGASNSASLRKDGSGGDFLKIERADAQPFQFYGMWIKITSYYSSPYYLPPFYNIKYYDENNAEITADTYVSSVQNDLITVTKNLKVKYVYVTLNACDYFILDNLIVGPAAASAPSLTSASINQFTTNTALLGGNVTSDGGATVTEYGIVYNTTGTPTTADSKVQIGNSTGTYSQWITGLTDDTKYYVRAYAKNSAGTNYGSEKNFTTATPFQLVKLHTFDSAWVSTTSQATPFTKYVEGWDVTATSTGAGLVSVSRISSATGTGAKDQGNASLRAQSTTSTEQLVSLGVKANNNSTFDLESFRFKYLTKVANTYFNTITVTGYLSGVAVAGATQSLSGIAQATSSSYAYTSFDLSANNNFNNIDEFKITASGAVSSATLSAIDIDAVDISAASTLPLKLIGFSGQATHHQSLLEWKTSQEQNTGSFEIEYSAEGALFMKVGTIAAAGFSATTKTYNYIHSNPAAGAAYYRLKMIDRDNKITYSKVIKVDITGVGKGITLYPNPVTDGNFVIELAGFNSKINYTIYNGNGNSVQEGSISRQREKITIANLPAGNYYIRLSDGQSLKLIKN